MFILSVGTLLTEHYDPVYKLLGINLFNILLNNVIITFDEIK